MSATASQTVHVNLASRAYDILIDRDLVAHAARHIGAHQPVAHALLVADENVQSYSSQIANSLESTGATCHTLLVESGEKSKSVDVVNRLWNEALSVGTHRQTVVIAVGGGVVGDLAGFVAATFARGLDFVQVPTTLLSQVDSSVGGKVGINLPGAKNMVGAFWQPKFVLIDTDLLATLPGREFRSGLAEVVKYGVILDADFFSYLEEHVDAIINRDSAVLAQVIARCCQLKADVVEEDELETSGRRAALNYGHTFGHAIEAIAGYGAYLHGEAISIGMLCASRLAESLSMVDASTTGRQRELLRRFGLPVAMPSLDANDLIKAMQRDKKVQHGKLRFILPDRLGHVELVGDVPADLVRQAILSAGS